MPPEVVFVGDLKPSGRSMVACWSWGNVAQHAWTTARRSNGWNMMVD